jgi:hypothetical protein
VAIGVNDGAVASDKTVLTNVDAAIGMNAGAVDPRPSADSDD